MSKIKQWFREMVSGTDELVPGGFLFSRLVYVWMILMFLWLSPIFGSVVGSESLTHRTAFEPTLLKNFIYILTYSPDLWKYVMAINIVSASLCLLNLGEGKLAFKQRYWFINFSIAMACKITAWITAIMLVTSTYFLFNAGIYLAGSWLFFLVFYFPRPNYYWKRLLNNWSILACRIQFLMVYFYSALYKWIDADWVNGDSIHFLSLLEQFTPDWLSSMLQAVPWLTTILTYFMLAYLTLFPILIWNKKLKNVLLAIGIGFHLYTMFIMKLYDFGAIMIVGYVLFFSKEHVTKIEKLVRLTKA